MKQVFHQSFLTQDIPRIREGMTEIQFAEFSRCVDKALSQITKNPPDGAPLERVPLDVYRKKKFHSVINPPQQIKADMRLIYRCDVPRNIILVFGVGKRKPHEPDDIYEILNQRDRI